MKTNKKWRAEVGQAYVFVREGHEWTGCEVLVVSNVAYRGFRCARCCDMAVWLFGKKIGVKEPKSWIAKTSELC